MNSLFFLFIQDYITTCILANIDIQILLNQDGLHAGINEPDDVRDDEIDIPKYTKSCRN